MRKIISLQPESKLLRTYKSKKMKKGIHPESYRTVIFQDFSVDKSWIGRSAADTKDTITWEDGNEYPLIKLEISSASHPFFTGKMTFVDTAGRIDKFNKKFAKFSEANPVKEDENEEKKEEEAK